MLYSMASSVTAVQGERFEFFFPLPRVPSGTQVTAYFKRGDKEIKTSDCGSRLGGGFWCTGTVPDDAPPGDYVLVRLTAYHSLMEERDIPNGSPDEGSPRLTVRSKGDQQ
jgi:hypothetical protein